MKYVIIFLILLVGCVTDKWQKLNGYIKLYKVTVHNIDSLQQIIYIADGNAANHEEDFGFTGKRFTKDYQLSIFDNKRLYSLTEEYNTQNLLLNSTIDQIKKEAQGFTSRERDSVQLLLIQIETDRPILAPRPIDSL